MIENSFFSSVKGWWWLWSLCNNKNDEFHQLVSLSSSSSTMTLKNHWPKKAKSKGDRSREGLINAAKQLQTAVHFGSFVINSRIFTSDDERRTWHWRRVGCVRQNEMIRNELQLDNKIDGKLLKHKKIADELKFRRHGSSSLTSNRTRRECNMSRRNLFLIPPHMNGSKSSFIVGFDFFVASVDVDAQEIEPEYAIWQTTTTTTTISKVIIKL